MINEQSSASGHNYASDRSAIGAGSCQHGRDQAKKLKPIEITNTVMYIH